MQLILEKFPEYEGNRAFRRVKYPREINGPEDEFFLIAFTSSQHKTVWILYSYLNVYLLAVLVGDEKIYVLDEKEFKFPARLLVGLERIDVNCGTSYTNLPARHEVRYSHTLICHSIFILSLGYTEQRSKEWKQGIVRAIGITCESLRFKWMRDVIKRTSNLNAYVTETPSAEIIKIMNNWDKVSRSVRSGNPFKLGTHTYPHNTLCSIVSLLNRNDGAEMENSENSLNKSGALNRKDGTEMKNYDNILNRTVPIKENIDHFVHYTPPCFSARAYRCPKPRSLVPQRDICRRGAIAGSLVPQHIICPRRANAVVHYTPPFFSARAYKCPKPRSLVPQRDICPRGSLVPQHIICPRRANAGSLVQQRDICPRGAIAGSLVPQHIICPRRANAVVHYTPPFFSARAYRCPKPLYSKCLISASRMMMFFLHHR